MFSRARTCGSSKRSRTLATSDDGTSAASRTESASAASLVAGVRDLFEDPQVRARENILSLVTPLVGAVAMPAVVPRLTLTPGRVEHAGPTTPGEHNEEIYAGRLGLSRADLARLRERGVI